MATLTGHRGTTQLGCPVSEFNGFTAAALDL